MPVLRASADIATRSGCGFMRRGWTCARWRTSASTMSTVGVGTPVRRPSSCTTPTSGSISIDRPRSRSCSIDILCAPTATAPSRRRSRSTRSRTPTRSPIGLRLRHHRAAQRARVRRLPAIDVEGRHGQRADRIEAHVAPELEPDLVADVLADRRFEPAGDQHVAAAARRAACARRRARRSGTRRPCSWRMTPGATTSTSREGRRSRSRARDRACRRCTPPGSTLASVVPRSASTLP